MQPLDGAYSRVKRAGKHLAYLNRRVNILSKSICESVYINRQPQKFILENGREINGFLCDATARIEPVPHIIKILIGEIVYNLRAALDYLVYELARLDSGKIIDNTQFLIEESPEGFSKNSGYRLKGINDKHVKIIEGLQPYNGCNWTRILRELSNPDKHRELTISNPCICLFAQDSTKANLVNESADINDSVSVHLNFRCGKSIVDVDTLKQLKCEVAQALHLFDSEFK